MAGRNGDDSKVCTKVYLIRNKYIITCDADESKSPLVCSEEINIKVMSDSICIYIRADLENALPTLLGLCSYFLVRMLRFSPPVLVRGGIAQGNIYSDGDVIFGDGLIRAYLLESKNAEVPRIIVTKDLLDKYSNCSSDTKTYMQSLLATDFDFFLYINCWPMFCMWDRKNGGVDRLYEYIESILNTTGDNSLRKKFTYLKQKILPYYNPEDNNA